MPLFLLCAVVGLVLLPQPAYAVLPPDLLFSVGATLVQFFSVAALIVGSIFSSLVFAARRWYSFSVQHALMVVGLIGIIVVVAISIVYLLEQKRTTQQYAAQVTVLQAANEALQQRVQTSVSIYEVATSSLASGLSFLSDRILLYGETEQGVFNLEFDFNRLETSPGVYTHYTFLDAYLFDEFLSEYDLLYATTSVLQANQFVSQVRKQSATDLSPRDTYDVTVLVAGEPLTLSITGLTGDFITRNQPTYTQHQSVGLATVAYQGHSFEVHALVAGMYASDYREQIFFPGRERVDATTHQFVLWDEVGNFYLIDQSVVRSDTPEYPSHTWVLYKSVTGEQRKSFVATVTPVAGETGGDAWELTAPELAGAKIKLQPSAPYSKNSSGRLRTVVTGSVTDAAGTRPIGGILHLVE